MRHHHLQAPVAAPPLPHYHRHVGCCLPSSKGQCTYFLAVLGEQRRYGQWRDAQQCDAQRHDGERCDMPCLPPLMAACTCATHATRHTRHTHATHTPQRYTTPRTPHTPHTPLTPLTRARVPPCVMAGVATSGVVALPRGPRRAVARRAAARWRAVRHAWTRAVDGCLHTRHTHAIHSLSHATQCHTTSHNVVCATQHHLRHLCHSHHSRVRACHPV